MSYLARMQTLPTYRKARTENGYRSTFVELYQSMELNPTQWRFCAQISRAFLLPHIFFDFDWPAGICVAAVTAYTRVPEKFECKTLFLRLHLSSTLTRHENGAFHKRSLKPKEFEKAGLVFWCGRNTFRKDAFRRK